MIAKSLMALALGFLINSLCAQIQKAAESSLTECAVSTRVPQFSLSNAGIDSVQPISIAIYIAANGKIKSIEFENRAIDPHREAIREALEASTFRSDCAGKMVRIFVSFKIKGAL